MCLGSLGGDLGGVLGSLGEGLGSLFRDLGSSWGGRGASQTHPGRVLGASWRQRLGKSRGIAFLDPILGPKMEAKTQQNRGQETIFVRKRFQTHFSTIFHHVFDPQVGSFSNIFCCRFENARLVKYVIFPRENHEF